MTKEIKDYLPYYIGQEIVYDEDCTWDKSRNVLTPDLLFEILAYEMFLFKIKLRPLSDMTEEEAITLIYKKYSGWLNVKFLGWSFKCGHIKFEFEYASSKRRRQERLVISELSADLFHYLLKQGFDLFNLIPDGLAIDKTTQP